MSVFYIFIYVFVCKCTYIYLQISKFLPTYIKYIYINIKQKFNKFFLYV